MKPCLRCGNPVTAHYHRVNSNNDGELWSCEECSTNGEVLTGPDDESQSERYERNLEKIREGNSLKEIRRKGL